MYKFYIVNLWAVSGLVQHAEHQRPAGESPAWLLDRAERPTGGNHLQVVRRVDARRILLVSLS